MTQFLNALSKLSEANFLGGLATAGQVALREKQDQAVKDISEKVKRKLLDTEKMYPGEVDGDPNTTGQQLTDINEGANDFLRMNAEYATAFEMSNKAKAEYDKVYNEAITNLAMVGSEEAKTLMSSLDLDRKSRYENFENKLKTRELNMKFAESKINMLNTTLNYNKSKLEFANAQDTVLVNKLADFTTSRIGTSIEHVTKGGNGWQQKFLRGTKEKRDSKDPVSALAGDNSITVAELDKSIKDILTVEYGADGGRLIARIDDQEFDITDRSDILSALTQRVYDTYEKRGVNIYFQATGSGSGTGSATDVPDVYNAAGVALSVSNTFGWLLGSDNEDAKILRSMGWRNGYSINVENDDLNDKSSRSIRTNAKRHATTIKVMETIAKSAAKDWDTMGIHLQMALGGTSHEEYMRYLPSRNLARTKQVCINALEDLKNPNSPLGMIHRMINGDVKDFDYGKSTAMFAGVAGENVMITDNFGGRDMLRVNNDGSYSFKNFRHYYDLNALNKLSLSDHNQQIRINAFRNPLKVNTVLKGAK